MALIPQDQAPEKQEPKRFNCKVCKHPDRAKIDAALYDGSMTQNEMARAIGVNPKTMYNHVKEHLSLVFVHTGRGKKTSLVQALNDVEISTLQVLAEAVKKKDHELALKAIGRREAQIKLMAELTGELRERRPSEAAEQRKAEQLERAVENLVEEAAKKGITVTPQEALAGLIKNEPDFANYVKLTKWASLPTTPEQVVN